MRPQEIVHGALLGISAHLLQIHSFHPHISVHSNLCIHYFLLSGVHMTNTDLSNAIVHPSSTYTCPYCAVGCTTAMYTVKHVKAVRTGRIPTILWIFLPYPWRTYTIPSNAPEYTAVWHLGLRHSSGPGHTALAAPCGAYSSIQVELHKLHIKRVKEVASARTECLSPRDGPNASSIN